MHVPCGGHSLIHAVTVDAVIIETIIHPEWMTSDCMDLVAGSLAVRYSGRVVILTTGPSFVIKKSHLNSKKRCELFITEAMREMVSIHNNEPVACPLAVAMPVNYGNSHWITIVAFPSERVVEY